MDTSPREQLVRLAGRIYHWLLIAYPAEFRRRFGPQMEQAFRDCCRDAVRRQGAPGILRLAGAMLIDLVAGALAERAAPVRQHLAGTSLRLRRLNAVLPPKGRGRLGWVLRPAEIRKQLLVGSDRFDRFTGRARKVLHLAQEEAQRLNHGYIGTEHLLLGLVREGDGVAARVLASLNVDLEDVRAAVETIVGRGDQPVSCGGIGLTPRAKRVIELAVKEARRLRHSYVGTEHLLLGLLREGEGVAADMLARRGVSLALVRDRVIELLEAQR